MGFLRGEASDAQAKHGDGQKQEQEGEGAERRGLGALDRHYRMLLQPAHIKREASGRIGEVDQLIRPVIVLERPHVDGEVHPHGEVARCGDGVQPRGVGVCPEGIAAVGEVGEVVLPQAVRLQRHGEVARKLPGRRHFGHDGGDLRCRVGEVGYEGDIPAITLGQRRGVGVYACW